MGAYFELYRDTDNRIACFASDNNSCDPHFHSNIEILYVTHGNISCTVNGETKILGPGDISIAGSYNIHIYTSIGTTRSLLMIIPTELIPSFTAMTKSMVFESPFLINGEYSGQIKKAIEDYIDLQDHADPLLAKGYAYVILGYLYKEIGLVKKGKSSNTELAREILVYMEQQYLESITIDGIAKQFGYNKDYLSRFFNAYLGCGFSHYLNLLRCRHAAQIISKSDDSLTDIAYRSGFSNYRTFNRAFLATYNVTPTDYRNTISR